MTPGGIIRFVAELGIITAVVTGIVSYVVSRKLADHQGTISQKLEDYRAGLQESLERFRSELRVDEIRQEHLHRLRVEALTRLQARMQDVENVIRSAFWAASAGKLTKEDRLKSIEAHEALMGEFHATKVLFPDAFIDAGQTLLIQLANTQGLLAVCGPDGSESGLPIDEEENDFIRHFEAFQQQIRQQLGVESRR